MPGGMIFKGTPGPWRIARERGTTGFIESIGPCAAEEYAGSSWLEVSDEDARLIAAAPDLLELLIEADKRVIWEFHLDSEFQERVEAAIAKALGEKK